MLNGGEMLQQIGLRTDLPMLMIVNIFIIIVKLTFNLLGYKSIHLLIGNIATYVFNKTLLYSPKK